MTGRTEQMVTMRREGKTLQEIGDVFGITRERVRQLVGDVEILSHPPCVECGGPMPSASAAKRFCSDSCLAASYRRECIDCGASCGRHSERCHLCTVAGHDARRIERFDRLLSLWDEGHSLKKMAELLGTTPGSISVQMSRAKHAGWEFVPRREGWKGHRNPSGREKQEPKTYRQILSHVAYAVRFGQLARAEACERCGAVGPVDGHHHDYSKPLDVEWLCRSCHMDHHRRERAAAKAAA